MNVKVTLWMRNAAQEQFSKKPNEQKCLKLKTHESKLNETQWTFHQLTRSNRRKNREERQGQVIIAIHVILLLYPAQLHFRNNISIKSQSKQFPLNQATIGDMSNRILYIYMEKKWCQKLNSRKQILGRIE